MLAELAENCRHLLPQRIAHVRRQSRAEGIQGVVSRKIANGLGADIRPLGRESSDEFADVVEGLLLLHSLIVARAPMQGLLVQFGVGAVKRDHRNGAEVLGVDDFIRRIDAGLQYPEDGVAVFRVDQNLAEALAAIVAVIAPRNVELCRRCAEVAQHLAALFGVLASRVECGVGQHQLLRFPRRIARQQFQANHVRSKLLPEPIAIPHQFIGAGSVERVPTVQD